MIYIYQAFASDKSEDKKSKDIFFSDINDVKKFLEENIEHYEYIHVVKIKMGANVLDYENRESHYSIFSKCDNNIRQLKIHDELLGEME